MRAWLHGWMDMLMMVRKKYSHFKGTISALSFSLCCSPHPSLLSVEWTCFDAIQVDTAKTHDKQRSAVQWMQLVGFRPLLLHFCKLSTLAAIPFLYLFTLIIIIDHHTARPSVRLLRYLQHVRYNCKLAAAVVVCSPNHWLDGIASTYK